MSFEDLIDEFVKEEYLYHTKLLGTVKITHECCENVSFVFNQRK